MLEEGTIQRNCVGAYAPRIHSGKLYLYRLITPERATLAVALNQSGRWVLAEIKASQNTEISPETLSAVHEWVKCAGIVRSGDSD